MTVLKTLPMSEDGQELSEFWPEKRLAKIASVVFSGVDKHSKDDELPVRLCNYVDVYNHDRIVPEMEFMEATATESEIRRFSIREGDVLATKDSEDPNDIAVAALVEQDMDGVLCGYHLAILRSRPHELYGPFLAWVHRSRRVLAHFESRATGVTRFGVSRKVFKSCPIPLPPVDEQIRIVAYLDASCNAIDLVMELKQAQLDTLDALGKSITTALVLTGLDATVRMRATNNAWLAEVPKHWKLVALKRVTDIQTGVTLGKTYEPPLVERPYLRAANVQDGYVDLEKVTTIEVPEAVALRHRLRPEDVLMTEGGDLDKLGRGTVWDGQVAECMHQNHVFALRCHNHKLFPKFLTYVTASRYGRDYFEATGKRTTNLASTNSTKVGLLPIPLPPTTEQQDIIDHIDARLTELNRAEECIRKQVDTLRAYRKSLIHECVTGKRRVADSDVAEVLAHV